MSTSAYAQVVIAPDRIPVPQAADRIPLKDAIDIHSHVDPDSFGPHSGQAARSLGIAP